MTEKKLLVVLIDAYKPEYLFSGDSPYLYQMWDSNNGKTLKPVLGYSDAIRSTIFTGKYPVETDYWMKIQYSPDTSPFKTFSKLAFLDRIPSDFIRRSIKFWASKFLYDFLEIESDYAEISLQNIPLRIIENFDYTLNTTMHASKKIGGEKTLFKYLSDNGLNFAYLDSSQYGLVNFFSTKRIEENFKGDIDSLDDNIRLIFLYIHHLDNSAHRYTTQSPKFQKDLKNVDSAVKRLCSYIQGRYGGNWSTIIFSDHGINNTKKFLDLTSEVYRPGFGEDYLLFLDSSMIRFWFKTEDRKREVMERFESMGVGRFLTQQELIEYHLDFNHNKYFEEVYLLDPEYSLFPNFISLLKPYAMHAYDPEYPSQKGIAIFDSDNFSIGKKEVELIDILPSILDYFEITYDGLEGDSFYVR